MAVHGNRLLNQNQTIQATVAPNEFRSLVGRMKRNLGDNPIAHLFARNGLLVAECGSYRTTVPAEHDWEGRVAIPVSVLFRFASFRHVDPLLHIRFASSIICFGKGYQTPARWVPEE